ncbi:hypothetical protein Y1Q_0000559 [Alligator mississippiensis]|uniref:Uncharacterized protein n=1 Tax=Alligator mississippiensis TaxID=8496 RepID=A0A151MBH9_ALLMI|nr:hypothetical protein Y1Q_0000559 [Alligator mississippiensis]
MPRALNSSYRNVVTVGWTLRSKELTLIMALRHTVIYLIPEFFPHVKGGAFYICALLDDCQCSNPDPGIFSCTVSIAPIPIPVLPPRTHRQPRQDAANGTRKYWKSHMKACFQPDYLSKGSQIRSVTCIYTSMTLRCERRYSIPQSKNKEITSQSTLKGK